MRKLVSAVMSLIDLSEWKVIYTPGILLNRLFCIRLEGIVSIFSARTRLYFFQEFAGLECILVYLFSL